jgi:hypothetical protein
MRSEGRPVTIQEVRNHIELQHPDLFQELSSKSHDYLRIMISVSPGSGFRKFECADLAQRRGSARTGYWGFGAEDYGPTWISLAGEAGRKARKEAGMADSGAPPCPADHCPEDRGRFGDD